MKKYRILGTILLSFILEGEQHDSLLDPTEGCWLEFDGSTIWYRQSDGQRFESITTPNAIDVFLRDKKIEEMNEEPN